MRITPAQAYGHPDFVTDVPVQGPTDEGMRAASCWWTQNVLPVKNPACADCNGPVPLWARNPTAWGGGWPEYGGNGGNCTPTWYGDRVRIGSRSVAGFALDGPSDPPATLSSDQQAWVVAALTNLNTQIGQSTGTSCASWQDAGTNLAAAVGCFQGWANANGNGPLRTDGVLDEDTLCALLSVAVAHRSDFPAVFPDPSGQRCYGGAAPPPTAPPPAPPPVAAPPAPPPAPVTTTAATVPEPPPVKTAMTEKNKWSTGAKVALGVAGAIVVGGITYTATKGKRR